MLERDGERADDGRRPRPGIAERVPWLWGSGSVLASGVKAWVAALMVAHGVVTGLGTWGGGEGREGSEGRDWAGGALVG